MLNHLLYIDPGTGSLFYQAILSAVLTVSIFGGQRMTPTRQEISYKDPAGFVVKLEDGFFRFIAYEYADTYNHLMQSGLYQALVAQQFMIPHKNADSNTEFPSYYQKIFPQQLDFISYPFEWSYSQWQQMILTYIRINEIALKHGMILKDASPYNFTFYNNKCILIDTLSFAMYKEGDPWIAYRQFCEEILSPFLLMHYKDPLWLTLYRSAINGLPLQFISRQLPIYTYFNPICLIHIHLHSRFQTNRKGNDSSGTGLNKEKLLILLSSIKKSITKKTRPLLNTSIWDKYYEKDIENETYINDKTEIITQWLREIKPNKTIDLGANTGKFSQIASRFSKVVYGLESDIYCVDEIYKSNEQTGYNNITPIFSDLVDPSPGLGWANKEKLPLLKRLKGDAIMGLALIHHLCLSRNIPLAFIARLFADLSSSFAIVEFVPKTDPKSQLLLQNKVLFSGVISAIKEQKTYTHLHNKKVPSTEIKGKKDLIWILLDEYASPNSLKSQFNFGDPLIDSLKSKNFFVFNTLLSRNDTTIYSLSALFNLDDSIPNQNYTYAANKLNKNLWVQRLKQNGYNFTSLDFFNISTQPKFYYLRIFPDNYMDQIFHYSILPNLWDKLTKHEDSFDRYNQNVIQKLPTVFHQKHQQPNFLWIHLLIPHSPFYRDANGKLNKEPADPATATPSQVIKQYTGYLSYANKVVLNILHQIPDWKNKVIVISGDHGARMLVPAHDPRRKQPFAAIYYLGMDTTALSKIKYLQQIPFHLH
eukprot:gene4756-5543_t